jgi:hypothetical protein
MMAANCRQFASVDRPENEDVAVLTVEIGDEQLAPLGHELPARRRA